MTSFYNRFLLDTTKENNNNVLKQDYTIDYSNYEKLKIAEQYNKLYSNTYEVNKNKYTLEANDKIFNIDTKNFLKKSSQVYINIINDISLYLGSDDKSLNKLGVIFTKNDNLIYIGILFIILSFFLWLIDITS
jgi:hypothetical protein